MAYQFSLVQPYIPTYIHLILSALFPIYAGAHASLSRPSSAAKSTKRRKKTTDDSEGEEGAPETSQRMEGLSPSDAILYPVLTGCMLTGLYFLIKWLKDPALLNKILNWYLSVFGVFSIAKLLSDSTNTFISFCFPARYSDKGIVWEVQRRRRSVMPRENSHNDTEAGKPRASPLPGPLSRIPLPHYMKDSAWWLRETFTQPLYNLEAYVHGVLDTKAAMGPQGIISFFTAMTAVLYFNLVDKPWWLTNLLGFAFSYSALQLMSPTTFWTGTLVLTSLFFYDIYFVFFTPLMITVATQLDIPVKLLFPRPSSPNEDPEKKSLSMLGLGDVVLPGIMIGLALRFDLHIFYLRKQAKRYLGERDASETKHGRMSDQTDGKKSGGNASIAEGVTKAVYRSATGGWGERFWLASEHVIDVEGGSFPKSYFHASIVGYIIGMICTLGVMQIYQHGQPALLYLVPGVLCSLWGTAWVRGDVKLMWEYSEAEEEEKKEELKEVAKIQTENTAKEQEKPQQDIGAKPETSMESVESTKDAKDTEDSWSDVESPSEMATTEHELNPNSPTRPPLTKFKAESDTRRRLIMFSVSLPNTLVPSSSARSASTRNSENDRSPAKDLTIPNTCSAGKISLVVSSGASTGSTLVRRSSDTDSIEPAEKRQRRN